MDAFFWKISDMIVLTCILGASVTFGYWQTSLNAGLCLGFCLFLVETLWRPWVLLKRHQVTQSLKVSHEDR